MDKSDEDTYCQTEVCFLKCSTYQFLFDDMHSLQ